MAANIEIKAHLTDLEATRRLTLAMADTPVEQIVQEDIFFNVPDGRLKLRRFADRSAELIFYKRDDVAGVKQSEYQIHPVSDPQSLINLFDVAFGQRGVVRKTRHLYLVGQTRIHLDQVDGLGDFLELEVVLKEGQLRAEGEAIARDLMERLEVASADLIDVAYIDLLELKEDGRRFFP
jgi:predicted adenylyl cyclase CyaB